MKFDEVFQEHPQVRKYCMMLEGRGVEEKELYIIFSLLYHIGFVEGGVKALAKMLGASDRLS